MIAHSHFVELTNVSKNGNSKTGIMNIHAKSVQKFIYLKFMYIKNK